MPVFNMLADCESLRTQDHLYSRHTDSGLPKMLAVQNYHGIPSPMCGPPLNILEGDVIELICADLHSSWWQGKVLKTNDVGFFPSNAVKPCPCAKPIDYTSQPWFATGMQRVQAEAELLNRKNSTYLVRSRGHDSKEYAISIKFNNEVKHIKILPKGGYFQIADNRKFKSITELIEYYEYNSLKEGFRTLDTTLQFPYKEPEHGSVLTPKVIGVAIARYDFSSRDMRELSLLEGEIVKIYSKSTTNGWWKGEVNGQVGWFPSTYVEEGDG